MLGTILLIIVAGGITVQKSHSYYWMVSCKIPLDLADKLYAHPEGRRQKGKK